MRDTFQFNRDIFRSNIPEQLAEHGFARVENILTEKSAKTLHKVLSELPEWNLVLRIDEKHYDVSASSFYAMADAERSGVLQSVYQAADNGFGYLYKNYPIDDLMRNGHCLPALEAFHHFINCEESIAYLRELTGLPNIEFLDAQATCYESGHFLSTHDDNVEGKNRLLAYVFNLSSNWESEWGGNLIFPNKNHKNTAMFSPSFNALSLIRIGTPHAVTQVSALSKSSRISITGWMRYR